MLFTFSFLVKNNTLNTTLYNEAIIKTLTAKTGGGFLLAPRGAYLHKNILAVSDTGQNRVLIWKNINDAAPSVILGQTNINDAGRNGGEIASASSLQYPSGIWTNGEKLIVADAWNHRVLIWNNFPAQNGQPADIVIGQKDFNSNQPNISGIGAGCCAQSLYWPYGLYSDGNSLWIADTGNRRVLFFEKIPTENFSAADAVIGQQNFEERDYDNNNAIWPYSVKINDNGSMLITDTQYYRVLFWHNWKDALNKTADLIFGQPDLNSNGQNRYQLKPSANTLNWCYDACFIKNGIAIADTGNSRILIWNEIPFENGAAAHRLAGQEHFEVNGESSLSMKLNVENEMYWPFAVNATSDKLVIADTGNHRVLLYDI